MADVTHILSRIQRGEMRAAELLLPLVYDELRELAAARMTKEREGQTLQATALVHEAYVRLVSGEDGAVWESRGHFFAAPLLRQCAEYSLTVLAKKKRVKHGGDRHRVELDLDCPASCVKHRIGCSRLTRHWPSWSKNILNPRSC